MVTKACKLSEYTPEIITFEEAEPTVGVGSNPCSMNNWYNNGGTTASLVETDGNKAWDLVHPIANNGGSNMNICQVYGESYTVRFHVLEATTTLRLLVFDYGNPVSFENFIMTEGWNEFSYTYLGSASKAR